MTRTLITGGAGFIGSRLAVNLNRLDHNILVIDDLSTGNRSNLPPLNNLKTIFKGIKPASPIIKAITLYEDKLLHLKDTAKHAPR